MKKRGKVGGTAALWLVTAGLALLFLAVWAADRESEVIPRQTPRPGAEAPVAEATPEQSAQQRERLNALAIESAKTKVDSRAQVKVDSVTVGSFKGADLQEASPADPDAQLGTVIVLVATVDGRETSKLTYHAVPPDRIVFVKQEAP